MLSVQRGSRSIQVTVNDRGPFTGAFLDLSPAAVIALGCRCTDRDSRANGVGWDLLASRGRQRSVVAAAVPPFFQLTGDVMRPTEMLGSTLAMAPAPRTTVATGFAGRTDPSTIREHPTRCRCGTRVHARLPLPLNSFRYLPSEIRYRNQKQTLLVQ